MKGNSCLNPTVIILLLLLVFKIALGQSILGTAHDFSQAQWNTTNQVCIVCHARHSPGAGGNNIPAWNHEVTSTEFIAYSSTNLDAIVGQPDGSSKLCLSCHDGTVALDNFGGNANGSYFISGQGLIGSNISDDHPISFVYDASLAYTDGGLADPLSANSGLGGTIDLDMLDNRKVQCTSCHDVHNTRGTPNLLIKSNNGSALCFTCHIK